MVRNIQLAILVLTVVLGSSAIFAGGPAALLNSIGVTLTLNGRQVSPGIDASTHSVQTIEYEHHEIHAGRHYFVASYTTLGSGASATFVITTPDSTRWAHMTFTVEGSLDTSLYICEGSSGVAGGNTVSPINSNRNSANTSVLSLVADPYVASLGVHLGSHRAGSGSTPSQAQAGSYERSHEIVMKQNATYTFRIVSGAAGNVVSWDARWYEHVDKN